MISKNTTKKLTWKFPIKRFPVLRIELIFVVLLALAVLILAYFQFDREWFYAALFSLLFLGCYVLASILIQKWQAAEERYHLTSTYLHIISKRRGKVKKEKVALADIINHKLDKLFLGGYLITKKGKKLLLFFNAKEELEKFEKHIKKYLPDK